MEKKIMKQRREEVGKIIVMRVIFVILYIHIFFN